ncbi:MAG TPA: CHASE domain-containing protein, partial [Thermoanaerobaculia bacterium]|nr:CHASE domain-containing protein [Thermoanaerobaculia bacterium]
MSRGEGAPLRKSFLVASRGRVLPTLGIALAYFVAARLALLLALPPGYATPFWPAAGLALASLLLWGRGLWPGVFLGSFVANVWTPLASPGGASLEAALAVPFAIAAGAALQAVVGALLVERFAAREGSGSWGRHLKLVLVGGPVSCVISASAGTLVLLAARLLTRGDAIFSWFTWWAGDSIGVVVFAPLVLLWSDRSLALRRKVLISLPVAVAFALAVALYVAASAWEQRQLQSALDRRAAIQLQAMKQSLDDYVEALQALRSFFYASEQVTQHEFGEFARGLWLHHPYAQALSWNAVVVRDQRAAFEEAARREGSADFAIRERGPGASSAGLVPAAPRRQHVVIRYVAPEPGNVAALGFDVASDPVRAEALARARDSGDVAATAPVTLVQDAAARSAVVLLLPVYRQAEGHHTIESRRRGLRGYVAVALVVHRLLAAAIAGPGPPELWTEVDDRAGGAPLFSNRPATAATSTATTAERGAGLHAAGPLFVGGRRWNARFWLTPAYLAANRPLQAWSILAAGLLFTGMLGILLLEAAERLSTIEALVSLRTDELDAASSALRDQNAVLAAVAASAERLFQASAWEEEVPGILARVGEAIGVSRAEIFQVTYAGSEPAASLRFSWVAAGFAALDMSGLQGIPFRTAGFGRWLACFQ